MIQTNSGYLINSKAISNNYSRRQMGKETRSARKWFKILRNGSGNNYNFPFKNMKEIIPGSNSDSIARLSKSDLSAFNH